MKRSFFAAVVSGALASSAIVAGQSSTPGQAFLDALVGNWDMKVYSDSAADFRDIGQRTFRRGHAELVLEWEERPTSSNNVGRGFLGFDAAAGKYFMIGVYSAPGASLVFLSGAPLDESAIRWIPVDVRADQTAANRSLIQSDLRRVSPDTLAWRAFDGRWEILLVRRSGRDRSSLP